MHRILIKFVILYGCNVYLDRLGVLTVFGAVIANVRAAIAGAVQWLSQNCQNKRRARYMYIVECILRMIMGY